MVNIFYFVSGEESGGEKEYLVKNIGVLSAYQWLHDNCENRGANGFYFKDHLCLFEPVVKTYKRKLTDEEVLALPFGSIIEVVWSKKDQKAEERYRGVVVKDEISYEDGLRDNLRYIAECVYNNCCIVYLEVTEHDFKE